MRKGLENTWGRAAIMGDLKGPIGQVIHEQASGENSVLLAAGVDPAYGQYDQAYEIAAANRISHVYDYTAEARPAPVAPEAINRISRVERICAILGISYTEIKL